MYSLRSRRRREIRRFRQRMTSPSRSIRIRSIVRQGPNIPYAATFALFSTPPAFAEESAVGKGSCSSARSNKPGHIPRISEQSIAGKRTFMIEQGRLRRPGTGAESRKSWSLSSPFQRNVKIRRDGLSLRSAAPPSGIDRPFCKTCFFAHRPSCPKPHRRPGPFRPNSARRKSDFVRSHSVRQALFCRGSGLTGEESERRRVRSIMTFHDRT